MMVSIRRHSQSAWNQVQAWVCYQSALLLKRGFWRCNRSNFYSESAMKPNSEFSRERRWLFNDHVTTHTRWLRSFSFHCHFGVDVMDNIIIFIKYLLCAKHWFKNIMYILIYSVFRAILGSRNQFYLWGNKDSEI